MRCWRLCRAPFWQPTGLGARLYGGRWNRRGEAMVYAAEHLSLAVLEVLVHLQPEESCEDFVAVALDVPDELVETLLVSSLPSNWRDLAGGHLVEFGSTWLNQQRSTALRAPSVVVPVESNVLLNPAHPGFSRVVVHPPEPFAFDRRLLPA